MRFDDIVAHRQKRDEKIRLVAINYQQYERRRQRIGIVVAILLSSIFMLLVWQIVTAPTNIGAPATESESIVRANERLLEMIKWTISTLLISGGALIGLNWYTGEARYNLDRAIAEQERIDCRINLEAEISIAIGTVEDEMEEFRERLSIVEYPEEDLSEYKFDKETDEFTLLESDSLQENFASNESIGQSSQGCEVKEK